MKIVYNKGIRTKKYNEKYCTNVYYWNNKQVWRCYEKVQKNICRDN